MMKFLVFWNKVSRRLVNNYTIKLHTWSLILEYSSLRITYGVGHKEKRK